MAKGTRNASPSNNDARSDVFMFSARFWAIQGSWWMASLT
jgi:hypothetical protein